MHPKKISGKAEPCLPPSDALLQAVAGSNDRITLVTSVPILFISGPG